MIKSLTVINPKNEALKLSLREPEESGLYIQDINGLGPPKSDVMTTRLAAIDGSLFSSSRITDRNIVMTLGMLDSPTIEEARLRTYKYFPIKKEITLFFETDSRVASVSGFVESNEPNIFSKMETAQISIVCPDPFFYDIGVDNTVFSGIRPMFSFPFANESLTENKLVFGEFLLDTRAILTYNGDVDTGVLITIHALGPANNITLYNIDTSERFSIDMNRVANLTGETFHIGDSIIISTIRGKRYAFLLREGLYTNIISAIDKRSDWFQLTSGDNIFMFTDSEGEEANIMITFSYRNAYGGI